MEISVTYIWLFAGVMMLMAEALGISGVGLLFAGLGCFTVGIFLNIEMIGQDATLLQFVVFLMATAFWTAVLWKPMRRFYSNRQQGGYKNMVGDTAYIGSNGLVKGKAGEATWSGTIMKAELSPDAAVNTLEAGAQAVIVDVRGATLIVTPKS